MWVDLALPLGFLMNELAILACWDRIKCDHFDSLGVGLSIHDHNYLVMVAISYLHQPVFLFRGLSLSSPVVFGYKILG